MDFYKEIRKELINNEINRKVKNYSINRSDLNTYYNVGKMLADAGKHYGEGIINEYSKKLTKELGKNYSERILYKMLKYYKFLSTGKVPTVSAKLSWSHYDEILKFDDINEITYYISISELQNLSIRQLRERIKNKEYERLPEETKRKIITEEERKIEDLVKNPILIKNTKDTEEISEKLLQDYILEDIPLFLDELGTGFTFIRNEYKIRIGNTYNYIDFLLYNIEFNCYVVVELKVGELKKEHIGQIEVYMNYVDDNLRRIDQDDTIGIIVTKKHHEYIIRYSSDKRILSREYELV